MATGILTFLNANLAYLRWIVLALAMLTSAWATHRIDVLRQNEKTLTRIQKQIEVVHDTKTIRDKVNALPGPDITGGLLRWQRD